MSHEIELSDGLALARERAWHGLGTVVAEAKSPEEMCHIAGLNWEVEQWPLSATNGEKRQAVGTHVLNVRSDNHAALGVVGKDWKPIHNLALAEFASALAQEGDDVVQCETFGSLRGGRRVFCLLRGESFKALPKDPIGTYILLAMGHDGTMSVMGKPTSVRVVCANTLHMAGAGGYSFRFKHTGDVRDKLEEARALLLNYQQGVNEYKEEVAALAQRKMERKEIEEFILDAWCTTEFTPPNTETAQKDAAAAKKREKAMAAYRAITTNLDRDVRNTGESPIPTAWHVMNAFTQWQQHQRKVKAKDEAARKENKVWTDQFGDVATKKAKVFEKALALV